jgi:hypothetical protein
MGRAFEAFKKHNDQAQLPMWSFGDCNSSSNQIQQQSLRAGNLAFRPSGYLSRAHAQVMMTIIEGSHE